MRINRAARAAVLAIAGTGAGVSPAGAQPYTIGWYTVDGGGATSVSGGGYTLGGTIGQPDAGVPATGGSYSLVGGFWNSTTVLPPTADLSVTQTDSIDPVTGLQNVTYTITVSNLGPHTANAVSLQNTLDSSVALQSFGGTGWSCGESGGVVTCTRTALAVGTAPDLMVEVKAPALAGTISNGAAASSDAADPVSANDTDIETTTVTAAPQADLEISKDDGSVTGEGLQPLGYTVAVTNTGPAAVVDAAVSDVVPPELSGVTWTCSASAGSSCAASGSGDISDTPDLLASATATYSVTGTVALGVTSVTNSASVAAPADVYDPNAANDMDGVTTPIVDPLIFMDGFESADTTQWSSTISSVVVGPPGAPVLRSVPGEERPGDAYAYRGTVDLDPLALQLEGERVEIPLGDEELGDRFGLLVERDAMGRYTVSGWVVSPDGSISRTPARPLALRPQRIAFEWIRGTEPDATPGGFALEIGNPGR